MPQFLDLFLEKLRIRSSGGALKRDSRNVEAIDAHRPSLEAKEEAAEKAGDVSKIQSLILTMAQNDEKAAFKLFDELVQVRLIVGKQLRLIAYIKSSLSMDKNLNAE